jgi:hypothetical protein
LLKHVEEDTVRRFKNISGSSEAQYFEDNARQR